MKTTWLKIKLWTKIGVFGAITLYGIAFILVNRNASFALDFVFKKYDNVNALLVMLLTCVFSIFGWWLFKTVFKTIRQMSDVRRRAELERTEKEHTEMISKAGKLQTRPESAETVK